MYKEVREIPLVRRLLRSNIITLWWGVITPADLKLLRHQIQTSSIKYGLPSEIQNSKIFNILIA